MLRELEKQGLPGLAMLVVLPAALLALVYVALGAMRRGEILQFFLWIVAAVIVGVLLAGFFVVNPNEGKVLQLFGDYKGTVKRPGLRWANPFFTKRRVSLRVRNFETAKLKVNDARGNPIEIGAIVVWRVVDTPEAVFFVDDYENYVRVQSEGAMGRPARPPPRAPPRRGRRPPAHRRGRGGHGRDGARDAGAEGRHHPRRGAQGGDGVEPHGGALQRALDAAGRQHGHAAPLSR